MTIKEIIQERGIREVLHFTTNKGLVGILYSQTLKPRARLPHEKTLEYIYEPNAAFRKDVPWLDYVNLSIGRNNFQFFEISAGRWHRGKAIWWCILSFDPIIMCHDGVLFSTTNNMYPSARRAAGAAGLEALFAPRIYGRYGVAIDRPAHLPPSYPTCEQAEVLYPGEVSTGFLRRVYVARHEDHDDVCGQCAALGLRPIEVVVSSEAFQGAVG